MHSVFEKIFLVGSGRPASECLRVLKQNGVEVVYISSEKPGGFQSSVIRLCEKLGITHENIPRKSLGEYFSAVTSESLIISVHNSYIFPPEITRKKNITIYNMHIALLPDYRGMNPATWAIFNCEEFAGVTWHIVNEKIDSGAILLQERVRIENDDTAMKLMLKCFEAGCRLFRENICAFLSKSLAPIEMQNTTHKRLYLAKELPNEGRLDMNWNFPQIWAFLRSMDYTGADVMLLPKITIGDREYVIAGYKKFSESQNSSVAAELHINALGGGA